MSWEHSDVIAYYLHYNTNIVNVIKLYYDVYMKHNSVGSAPRMVKQI